MISKPVTYQKYKAKKHHQCLICEEEIIPGEEYFSSRDKYVKRFDIKKICGKCYHKYQVGKERV